MWTLGIYFKWKTMRKNVLQMMQTYVLYHYFWSLANITFNLFYKLYFLRLEIKYLTLFTSWTMYNFYSFKKKFKPLNIKNIIIVPINDNSLLFNVSNRFERDRHWKPTHLAILSMNIKIEIDYSNMVRFLFFFYVWK